MKPLLIVFLLLVLTPAFSQVQVSGIVLDKGDGSPVPFAFSQMEIISQLFDLFLEGYMAWLKNADLLPLDYWPSKDE